MKKFPGEVRNLGGQSHKMFLDDEQKKWLAKYYPVTENLRLSKAMGISLTKLHDFAMDMHLEKSEEGKRAIIKRSRIAAVKTNEKNGCYDRKRGHPVSEATIAGRKRRWQEEKEGLRENAQLRMKREDPDKYRVWMQKRSIERKESIRREKLRVMYGLERHTRLKAVVMCPFRRSQTHHRCNALKRGYVLDADSSEQSESRYVIYYDAKTKRSARFEKNCINDGFTIRPWV